MFLPPRPLGGAVSVAAQDAVVDAKGKTDGHHQIEIETRKVRSQNFIFSETTGEAARAHGAEAYADR